MATQEVYTESVPSSCNCLACGEVIRAKEGRNLSTSASNHVVSLWKSTISEELARVNQVANLDVVLREGAGHICRKCFYAYERVLKAKEVIAGNAVNAVDIVITVAAAKETESESDSDEVPFRPPAPKRRPPVRAVFAPNQHSPDAVVYVNYKKPRTFTLTPSRKRLGKALARGSRRVVAIECLKDPTTRRHILKKIGILVRNEMIAMCTDARGSILRSQSSSAFKEFSWDTLLCEAAETAPLLLNILQECVRSRRSRPNQSAVIGMCFAILLKHRFSKMSLVQRILTLILHAGHCGKQVYERLQKVNVSMSHKSSVRLLTTLGDGFDASVLEWRDKTTSLMLQSSRTEVATSALRIPACRINAGDDDQLCSPSEFSDGESDAESSDPSISPFSSDDELSEPEAELDESESEVSENDHDESDLPSSTPSTTIQEVQHANQHLGYKIVGDNIDKTVKARYMRTGSHRNQSLHYFHSLALRSRIDFSHLPNVYPDTCSPSPLKLAESLLPSASDDQSLRDLFIMHVSRVLSTHIPFFEFAFEDVVEWHRKHDYYKQMSSESVVVPLGVLDKNENKSDDMVEIMSHLLKYTPVVEYNEDVQVEGDTNVVERASVYPILFGGDQLTAARARGAKKAKINSYYPVTQLDGLIPCAEDWHTKMNFLGVIWKYFYSKKSGREHGTLYQLRNVLHRTNVSKPDKDFNACDDFFVIIVNSHILAAAFQVLNMKSAYDNPTLQLPDELQDVWTHTKEVRAKVLTDVCKAVVDKFITFQFHASPRPNSDRVFGYTTRLLSIGCFYLEYCDAIREGDGDRLLRCWRYMLPAFRSSGRKNYAVESLNMLCQVNHALTPRQSAELLWSRFVNTQGLPGHNIASDLHLEHLNRICKDSIQGLGRNKTVKSITRVGKAMGTLSPVLSRFDDDNKVTSTRSSGHKPPSAKQDVNLILEQLQQSEVFNNIPGRKHRSFPNPRDVLHHEDHDELKEWMKTHLRPTARMPKPLD